MAAKKSTRKLAKTKPSAIIPRNYRHYFFLEKYVKSLTEGKYRPGLARDIVAQVYPDVKSDAGRYVMANKILKRLANDPHVTTAMNMAGADMVRVGQMLSSAIDATRPVIFEGEVVSQWPDHQSRIAAGRLVSQLQRALKPAEVNVNTQINVVALPAGAPLDFKNMRPIIPAGAVPVKAEHVKGDQK